MYVPDSEDIRDYYINEQDRIERLRDRFEREKLEDIKDE